ncbi:hypothetical protein [Leuconostoc citreum]|nr:hypothetical protein [Leuconostoc citreum]MBU7451531.1 hypothetical protein [Leuconostoc citreum]
MRLLTDLMSVMSGVLLAQGVISGDLWLIGAGALLFTYNVLQDDKED